jgi:glycosyltransferase involved in cell wall biosynthesis
MRNSPTIAYLTAGAAGMICGSCLRDNALAAALSRLDCDVQLISLYTPIRTDEEDVSEEKIFFGGINVYLQQKSPIFRWLPRFLDRALDHPWLVKKLSSGNIETSARELGELAVSMLRGDHGLQKKEVHRLCDFLRQSVRPDLINLTNVLIAGSAPLFKKELGVPVLATLQGDDLFLEQLEEPYREQALAEIRRLVCELDGFIVFSHYYADFMSGYLGIPRERIHVVPLGLNTRDFQGEPPERESGPPRLGYLARICPEKGFHLLVDAFLQLRKMEGTGDVQLQAAGWLGVSDGPFFSEQLDKIRRAGEEEAFHHLGVIERNEKVRFLQQLDVFSVPTVYREPKGLYVLEAGASGVPVVQPRHGIFPEMLAEMGGLLFEPGNVAELTAVLHKLLTHPEESRRLGQESRKQVLENFTAERMAAATLEVYRGVLED